MSDLKGYSIKHLGAGAYVLVDDRGNITPHQIKTTLESSSSNHPTFTVVFQAGSLGLRVEDPEEESNV